MEETSRMQATFRVSSRMDAINKAEPNYLAGL